MRSLKIPFLITITLMIGIGFGLIVASNFDWTEAGVARDQGPVQIGSQEPDLKQDIDLAQTSKAYVQVVKRVMPTVVSITSEKIVRFDNPFTDFFREEFWRERQRRRGNERREFRQEGLGSGVIISPDGYIVTNNHVIREAQSVIVLIDRKKYKAEIIGTDPKTDLAVIRIDVKNLSVAKLGDSDNLEVGELVLAIGSPFSLQLAHSVTAGIVSGKGRTRVGIGDIDYEDFIQTDAAINPGNSGGALVNLQGELVGINTAIVSGGWSGGNVGIGFAIPINLARQVIKQLIENGKVVRGWLGVAIESIDHEVAEAMDLNTIDGALVRQVTPDSPAMKAGLQEGDFITEVDGTVIRDDIHLMNLIAGYQPESKVIVKYIRDHQEKSVSITLGERPDNTRQYFSSQDEGGDLGLTVEELSDDLKSNYNIKASSGVVVVDVEDGSPAQEEGIQPGDVILEINRKPISTVAEFRRILAQTQPEDVVLLRIMRDESKIFVALKAGND